MTTRTFVKLQKLDTLWTDDERWMRNVAANAADGYTLATDDDDSDSETADFMCCELEFVDDGDVKVYDFMGSEHEQERFYEKDIVVYKHADGSYWVMYYEDIYSF